ncbi:MAG: iron transporter [Candidatus Bathyarchaeota archaeon B23]|nr:MAG: iron transporter [Candidatus Bathyarchaeota archaeon B23]
MSVREVLGEEPEVEMAEERYRVIGEILSKVFKGVRPLTLSDLLDKAFLDRYLGIPIFLALWWALFRFTFDVSAFLSDLIDIAFSRLGEFASSLIGNEWWSTFVADGICGGLGGVLVFIPPIFFLFFGLSLLEDSGYLARAAFVVDKALHPFGLQGRSFIPLLLGFGCNIPGVMAARTIPSERDRILTILVNPLITCSARLPIYVLIAGAVLGAYASMGVFTMYLLSMILALLIALIFKALIPYFRGRRAPFILELPSYARPTMRSTLAHMYERGILFLKKAGTIIFLGIIVVWLLSSHPWGAPLDQSYIATLGRLLEPLFRPLGFDWRGAVALFFGFIAKEIVVGTFAIFFGLGEEAGMGEIQRIIVEEGIFTPLTGFAFMAFTLIYIPCVATVGIIYRETNSIKWTLFTVIYGLALAYLIALLIVTIGGLMGVG